MKLAQYLTEARLSHAEFAARIGVANGKVVHRYAKGQRMPEPAVMARIVEATDGQVRPDDFYDLKPAAPVETAPVEGGPAAKDAAA